MTCPAQPSHFLMASPVAGFTLPPALDERQGWQVTGLAE
jgi:hypothetical protein